MTDIASDIAPRAKGIEAALYAYAECVLAMNRAEQAAGTDDAQSALDAFWETTGHYAHFIYELTGTCVYEHSSVQVDALGKYLAKFVNERSFDGQHSTLGK